LAITKLADGALSGGADDVPRQRRTKAQPGTADERLRSINEHSTSCCPEPVLPAGSIPAVPTVSPRVALKMRLPQLGAAPGAAETALPEHAGGGDGPGVA